MMDVQAKFKRCLDILQINEVKGLTNFLKNEKEDVSVTEQIAMKFNMTREESNMLITKVLNASSRGEIIEKFIEIIGKQVVILDKQRIQ